MNTKNPNYNQFFNFINFCKSNRFQFDLSTQNELPNSVDLYKNGSKIEIKKKNRGAFTRYCNGKVTSECISRGKNSSNPKVRKMATFAQNARSWKHKKGGVFNKDV